MFYDILTLLHSERLKLYTGLAFLSVTGLMKIISISLFEALTKLTYVR